MDDRLPSQYSFIYLKCDLHLKWEVDLYIIDSTVTNVRKIPCSLLRRDLSEWVAIKRFDYFNEKWFIIMEEIQFCCYINMFLYDVSLWSWAQTKFSDNFFYHYMCFSIIVTHLLGIFKGTPHIHSAGIKELWLMAQTSIDELTHSSMMLPLNIWLSSQGVNCTTLNRPIICNYSAQLSAVTLLFHFFIFFTGKNGKDLCALWVTYQYHNQQDRGLLTSVIFLWA